VTRMLAAVRDRIKVPRAVSVPAARDPSDPTTSLLGRPDPYRLPSDTPFRFVLLILAVLGSSLFAYQLIFLAFHGRVFVSVVLRCNEQLSGSFTDATSGAAKSRAAAVCRSGLERSEARWMLAGVLLLAATAAVLLFLVPWQRRRRSRMEPIDAADNPRFLAQLAELGQQAGVPDVTFVMDALDPRRSAVAFGRPGRRTVLLRGGLVTTAVTNPPVFRAVVLHELAHVRNRDIDQAYAAISVSAAFLLVALLPLAAVVRGSLPIFALTWRLLVLGLLVYLLLKSLLRSRELYADARVVAWGAESELGAALASVSAHPRRLLGTMRALHPSADTRIACLTTPWPLFRLGFVDGLAVGVVAFLTVPQLTFLVGLLTASSLTSGAWATVPVAPLVAAVLVIGLWRQRYASRLLGRRSSAWPVGVGLALGLAIGSSLAMNEAALVVGVKGAVSAVAWHVGWAALLLAVVAPLASWVSEGARTTFDGESAAPDARRVRRTRSLCLVVVAVTSFVVGNLMYQLGLVRLLLTGLNPSDGVRRSFSSSLTVSRDVLNPDVLRSPVHVALLGAWLLIPWVATRRPWEALKTAAPIGVATGLAVPFLFVLTTVIARQKSLRTRWPFSFPFTLERFYEHSALLACLAGATIAALMHRRRPLAAGGAAAVVAALIGQSTLMLTRPVQSCFSALTTTPASSSCPAYSSRPYVEFVAMFVLAGGIGATVTALPALSTLLRGTRRAMNGSPLHLVFDRMRTHSRVAWVLAVVLGALALVPVSVAAVGRAGRSTSGVVGTIGRDGLTSSDGYQLRLRPGWLDVTAEPAVHAAYPNARQVLRDTDGSGVLAVVVVPSSSGNTLDQLANAADFAPRTFAPFDGEHALALEKPGGLPEADVLVVSDHRGLRYGLFLYTSPSGRASDRAALRAMSGSWRWR
jgi:Zn-dependent protease with chaperone function